MNMKTLSDTDAPGEIGRRYPAEHREIKDPETGRILKQWTSAPAYSYPLYYFIPSITADGKYMVFHSERTGWVQMYRLCFETGEIVQLTEGRTHDSGWAMWCEKHLRGVYNQLSALNRVRNEVFYFQDDEIRSTHILTFKNRRVCFLPPGQVPVSQTDISPDGKWFVIAHTDGTNLEKVLTERRFRLNMNMPVDHEAVRNAIGETTLAVVCTDTGEYRRVAAYDHYFQHALFIDNETILVNHPKNTVGMFRVDLNGENYRHLRPHTDIKAHGAHVCHQVITQKGILYEAIILNEPETSAYLGKYDLKTDTFEEYKLPFHGRHHVGNDPGGEFLFFENQQDHDHCIYSLDIQRDSGKILTRTLCKLRPYVRGGQREHAHPFLGPDRKSMFFTALDENNISQIHEMDISDLGV